MCTRYDQYKSLVKRREEEQKDKKLKTKKRENNMEMLKDDDLDMGKKLPINVFLEPIAKQTNVT